MVHVMLRLVVGSSYGGAEILAALLLTAVEAGSAVRPAAVVGVHPPDTVEKGSVSASGHLGEQIAPCHRPLGEPRFVARANELGGLDVGAAGLVRWAP
jgi:hypothetical protein